MKLLKVGIVVNSSGCNTVIKALAEPEMLEIFTPVILSIDNSFSKAVRELDSEQQFPLCAISNADDILDGRINVIETFANEGEAIDRAVALYLDNHLDTIIDISATKRNRKDTKDLCARLIAALNADNDTSLVWYVKGETRLIQSSAETLTTDVKNAWQALRRDHTLIKPRIAILAKDDKTHEQVTALREEGFFAFGPFAAENFIETRQYKPYDAIIVVDGDEDLGKTLEDIDTPAFGYISGLPMVFTYLAEVTAESDQDFKAALYSSISMSKNRRRYRYATSNPLEKQWIPRGKDDFKLDLTKEDSD